MVIPLSERESPERRKDEVFVYDEDLHSYGARDPYRGSVKKELREKEKEDLPGAIRWLHQKNPWFTAYKNSLREIKDSWKQIGDTLAQRLRWWRWLWE